MKFNIFLGEHFKIGGPRYLAVGRKIISDFQSPEILIYLDLLQILNLTAFNNSLLNYIDFVNYKVFEELQ